MARCFSIVAGAVALWLGWLYPACAAGAGGEILPGAQLPAGETAIAMAWSDAHTLCLLVQSGEGYALRDLDVRSGEFAVVNVPPSFKRIRPGGQPRFVLAPDASGLAVINDPALPLQPGEIAIFRRSGGKLDGVEQRGIPANFWAADAAWGRPGELYLTARHYLNPEQPYSVGRLDIASGRFDGVVLKANLDLVDELTPLPERGLLLMRSWGYHGEYPSEPVIAAWNLTTAQSELLHSQARRLVLSALDGQQALLVGQEPAGDRDAERWILQTGQGTLRRLEKGMASKSSALKLSPDGSWLVVLIAGRELSKELSPDEVYVAMQAVGTGRTLATAVPCEQFTFAPDGSSISALGKGGRKVYYYALPDTGAAKASAEGAASQEREMPQRQADTRTPGY